MVAVVKTHFHGGVYDDSETLLMSRAFAMACKRLDAGEDQMSRAEVAAAVVEAAKDGLVKNDEDLAREVVDLVRIDDHAERSVPFEMTD